MSAVASDLPVGHYAVGVLADGEEVDIYRASATLLMNVATGQLVTVTAWHKPDKKTKTPSRPF
jgi:hypothetical protein